LKKYTPEFLVAVEIVKRLLARMIIFPVMPEFKPKEKLLSVSIAGA
jgi:hypothetical protein